MNKSKIDNVLPEQENSKEQKAEETSSSPNSTNTSVARSFPHLEIEGVLNQQTSLDEEGQILLLLNGQDVRTAKRTLENILNRLDANSVVKAAF